MKNFEIENKLTLDEELNSEEFNKQIETLYHIPQMQKQSYKSNSLADNGRYPEHMYL